MASSTLSFPSGSNHRGNVDPLIHNISNHPVANISSSKMAQDAPKNNSHRGVQYRRSGQYYRYSTASDRVNQAPPTRYIAERSTAIAEPKAEPEPATTDAHVILGGVGLTTEELLEEETDEGMREWLLECLRQERELVENHYSCLEDCNDDGYVCSLQDGYDNVSAFEAPQIETDLSSEGEDDDSHLADNEENETIPFQETSRVASTASEGRDDQSNQREVVVQALRKLYEPGRRLRRRLENKTEERDAQLLKEPQEPPVVVVTPTKLRASALSRHTTSDTANDDAPLADANSCETQDEVNEDDDDEDFYNYYNGDTSEFYSDDLVVEWGSTQSFEEMVSKPNDHSSTAQSQQTQQQRDTSSFAAVSRRAMGKKHRKRVLFDVYHE